MDNIILGLLLMSSRTIYQLRERIAKGLHLMYSSSMGSIQAALKKLLKDGCITYTETVENGKYKKIYSITDTGRARFYEWVNSPFEAQAVKNPELSKLYFMGFAEKEKRVAAVEEHLLFLKEQYAALYTICEEAADIEIPEECRDILTYQLAAARYGRDFMKFNMEWYGRFLKEVKEERSI